MLKYLLFITFTFIGNVLLGQCLVEFTNADDTVYTCAGSPVDLFTDASLPILIEPFSNSGPISTMWDSITPVSYGNVCGPINNSSTDAYCWFGGGFSRFLMTKDLNLSYPEVEVCFDFKMAIQDGFNQCEGPDEYDEGISFQYSLDNGITWIDIIYFAPNGDSLLTNPNVNNPIISSGAISSFQEWNQYCFVMPQPAISNSTKFKWEQFNYSGVTIDRWGIDNISIKGYDAAYNFSWNISSSTSDSLNLTPSQNDLVTVSYSNNLNDTCTASTYINTNYVIMDSIIRDTICDGLSLSLNNGMSITSTGIYKDTLIGVNCDSIITLNLWVTPMPNLGSSFVRYCDSIIVNGTTIYSPTSITDTLFDTNGCRYRKTKIYAATGSVINTQDTLFFCDSIVINGISYASNQQLEDSLIAFTNCDSIHKRYLIKDVSYIINTQDTLKYCDSIFFGGITYYFDQSLINPFVSITGCDSIHTTYLVEAGTIQTFGPSISFCDSISINGLLYNASQQIVDSFSSPNFCDSLYIINIVKNATTTNFLPSLSFCDSILIRNNWYFNTQTATDTLLSISGCDSMVIQDLILDNSIAGKITTSTGADLANSMVYLIEYWQALDSLYIVDSMLTNATGNYAFLSFGTDHYLKVVPELQAYPEEITTYYPSSPVFQFAQETYCGVFDFSTIDGVNIGGNGFINGFLGNGASKNNELGEPIEEVDVILIRSNQVAKVERTAQNGYFEFNNIPCNLYEIWIDDLRVDNLIAPEIDLSEGACREDSLIFVLDNLGLRMETATGIRNLPTQISLQIIPNPAKNQVQILLESEEFIKDILIMDVIGREMLSIYKPMQQLSINTQAWSNGLYKVVLYGKDNTYLGSKSLMIQH